MKTFGVAIVLLGLIAANSAFAQQICAGAEGASQACAPRCSNQIVNDDVNGTPNQGKFNVGGGNQGDGNDGFNNVGSFNVGSSNKGNCGLGSGTTGGQCDVSNSPGQIVLRYCAVLPAQPQCQPSGYLPEFSQALRSQIATIVASCNGVVVPPTPPTPTGATPPAGAIPPAAPGTPPAPSSTRRPEIVPIASAPGVGARFQMPAISDSKADLATLLQLLDEHINQEKQTGRKLKL